MELLTNKETRITSVELVELINELRTEESKLTKKKCSKLLHKSFMTKIKNELEVLESLGLGAEQNILLGSYMDKQNQERPCYSLNRDGMLQMLNSESVYVRAKTIQYIDKLEVENKQLKEDNKSLYEVATSPAELAEREYQANKVKYALRNVETLINDCSYATLEATVNKIIEVHTNLKTEDRYNYHQKLNATEYKQKVREFVVDKIEKHLHIKDALFVPVAYKLIGDIQGDINKTTNRSTSHIISHKEKQINDLKEKVTKELSLENDFIELHCHLMSNNRLYSYTDNTIHKSYAYKNWIKHFPYSSVLSVNESAEKWNLDLNGEIGIELRYIAKEEFDISNGDKAIIDMIFNRILDIDDNIVEKRISERIGTCNDYSDGRIYYRLFNI